MAQLLTKPSRAAAPAPTRLPLLSFTVHYTVNGSRGSWQMFGYTEALVRSSFNELLPQARVNLISRDGEW
jgi:hypothetical protein